MRASLCLVLALALMAQQPPAPDPVFRTSSNLVLVTVFARDKQGKPLAGLKKEDFTLLENGKPQTISVFDFQNIEGTAAASPNAVATPAAATEPQGPQRFRDRRLLVGCAT